MKATQTHKPQINRTREKFLRVRVNDAEYDRCAEHSEAQGFRSVADWLRDCANKSLKKAGLAEIPQQQIGAPKNNHNKAGKTGANQHSANENVTTTAKESSESVAYFCNKE